MNNFFSQSYEFCATRHSDDHRMLVKLKRVSQLMKGDYQYLQVFNIIMRKCLEFLDLRLVGRNFFDPHNKVKLFSNL